MKIRILTVALLVAATSVFGACAFKKEDTSDISETKPQQTTHSTTAQTTAAVTEPLIVTELSTVISTTQVPPTALTTTTRAPATTKKPSTTADSDVSTTSKGRVYKDNQIEVVELKYGVVERRYKTVYYQMIDGERVDVGYEYTSSFFNRSNYSATYQELLPAARANREIYRDYINENLRIINSYRAAKGIAPLRLNEDLTVMACARAEEIAWSGEHSHRRPDGTTCFTIFKEAGYNTGKAGENLGYVFDNPEDVCQAWKDSRTHYNNLMNPDFVEVGIGVAADPDERGKLCWANHFLEAR